jgi:membrane associated rhomboid family serine protease
MWGVRPVSSISDRNLHRKIPWVTLLIILANTVFFLLELTHSDLFTLRWAFIPQRFLSDPASDFPTLFTSMFLHAGWLHFLSNILFLGIFGDKVEDRFGHIRFVIFYLICGLAATFAQMALDLHSDIPGLGASGAIAGVLAAYVLIFPFARVKVLTSFFTLPVPALLIIGAWIGLQFFSWVGSIGNSGVGLAYMAHIGGFIAGLILTPLMLLGRRGPFRESHV